MELGIVIFFAVFFGVSLTLVVLECQKLYAKNNVQKQELYPNVDYIYDKSINKHPEKQGMTEKEFQSYKNSVMALELP